MPYEVWARFQKQSKKTLPSRGVNSREEEGKSVRHKEPIPGTFPPPAPNIKVRESYLGEG